MKVEYSGDAKQKRTSKRKSKHKKVWPVILMAFVILFISVFTALSLTVLFNVKTIKVAGESMYSVEQIISASGIKIGKNLVRLSADEHENNVERYLPYVGSAEIIKSFPDSIYINVTPAKEYAAFKIDDKYAKVDAEYKVLEIVQQQPMGLLLIRNIEVGEISAGVKISFTDEAQRDSLKQLKDILADTKLHVTQIDVNSAVDMNFCIEDRIYVKLGSANNINEKILHLVTTIENLDKGVKGSISLSQWSESNKKATMTYEDISDYLG